MAVERAAGVAQLSFEFVDAIFLPKQIGLELFPLNRVVAAAGSENDRQQYVNRPKPEIHFRPRRKRAMGAWAANPSAARGE